MKTVYEDDQYKVLCGSSKKGCMSARRTDKLVVIDKLLGVSIRPSELPSEVYQQLIKDSTNDNT